jgi:hypothetical protein
VLQLADVLCQFQRIFGPVIRDNNNGYAHDK